MVPFEQMQELNRLRKAPGTWVECPHSGHMDAYVRDETLYWRSMRDFWIEHVEAQ